MIPKIIHYCWFGGASKSNIAQQCIASWKKYCPDYKFIEWNENNTKDFQNKFYKDAYRKREFAFVADCVRVQVLHVHGGIYLDLDMLLLKPIDALLDLDFFIGYEVAGRPAFGIFGGVSKHRFFKEMKEYYDTNYFNPFSLPVITHTFKKVIIKEALQPNERIFEPITFYPLPYKDRHEEYVDFITPSSYAVHLWEHSWEEKSTETIGVLVKKLSIVCGDYFMHGYPNAYFKRYFKEFGRKLYYKLTGRNT
ncbi:glycosyltransferase family 32 protein [Patiriisocius hiemis]|uniref:Glycosyltransferase n=1 Tax=Patiriisocius hiemis TaxID=3075604 RepID=A0ABU2YG60_9FLAO|nr:glycosyltransferase [Constantimarinum sp. W242]MDT0556033.1 glycosyltransferase [Constantimarinum sp. W242]